MPDSDTLGQLAYRAWWTAYNDGIERDWDTAWAQATVRARAAWEAMAEALYDYGRRSAAQEPPP